MNRLPTVYPHGVDTAHASSGRPPYEAGPGRRAVVAADLSELHGPTSGVVELPHRLFWQPDRHVDLDNPALLAWMYETVLREAATVDELRTWLHGSTLVRLWPRLFVPRGVRRAWEERHPALHAGDLAA
jgi:hypothetical protein